MALILGLFAAPWVNSISSRPLVTLIVNASSTAAGLPLRGVGELECSSGVLSCRVMYRLSAGIHESSQLAPQPVW